jgi:hypothetical protein
MRRTLHYFALRPRTEPSHLVIAYGNLPVDIAVVPFSDWPT